jgi:hypothetical protein
MAWEDMRLVHRGKKERLITCRSNGNSITVQSLTSLMADPKLTALLLFPRPFGSTTLNMPRVFYFVRSKHTRSQKMPIDLRIASSIAFDSRVSHGGI